MRDKQWKLLMYDDGSGKELYNLVIDHAETKNVAEKHPEIVEGMGKQLKEWKESL